MIGARGIKQNHSGNDESNRCNASQGDWVLEKNHPQDGGAGSTGGFFGTGTEPENNGGNGGDVGQDGEEKTRVDDANGNGGDGGNGDKSTGGRSAIASNGFDAGANTGAGGGGGNRLILMSLLVTRTRPSTSVTDAVSS